jgi:hypothetical protein
MRLSQGQSSQPFINLVSIVSNLDRNSDSLVDVKLAQAQVATSAKSTIRLKPPPESPQTGSTWVMLNKIGC